MNFFSKKDGTGRERLPVWILIVGAALGIGLLLLGGYSREQAGTEEPAPITAREETDAYRAYLEAEIERLCASMGLPDACVVVTLGGSFAQNYATELHDGNEEYVILGGGSSAHALLLSESAPEIVGIGVICPSGADPALLDEVVALLSTALDTPTNRIWVTTPK